LVFEFLCNHNNIFIKNHSYIHGVSLKVFDMSRLSRPVARVQICSLTLDV
jgi:hypothetical protein